MKPLTLLFDGDFLCYRAWHTPGIGKLENKEGQGIGVICGVVRSLLNLCERFQPVKLNVAFDHGKPERLKIFPDYKKARREKQIRMTDSEKVAWNDFDRQRTVLKEELLDKLGFGVCYHDGLEADDIIAHQTTLAELNHEETIIVSADKDLFQLIGQFSSCFNPITNVLWNLDTFRLIYGLLWPYEDWCKVKAIAGCGTDSIPGVKGVGEHTAIKFIAKLQTTNEKTPKKEQAIREFIASPEYQRNRQLVKLPFVAKEYEMINWPITLYKPKTSSQILDVLRPLGITAL